MATFAILHFWGFPWQPYKINKKEDSLFEVEGTSNYQGGWLGAKAIFDAMNPWDLCKAIARGLRWLFVGRKQRTLDPSYSLAAKRGSQQHEYHQLP